MARLKLKIQQPWIPYIIFIVTLILTLIATYYVSSVTYAQDRFRFFSSVQDTNTNIHTQLETYIALLRGTAGLFAATPDLNKEEFSNYVTRLSLEKNYSGAMGVGFVEKVPDNEKDTFIQTVDAQDNAQMTIQPNEERSTYYVVRFLTRKDNKMAASVGYDLYANPIFKSAMDKARDSGSSYASGKEIIIDKPTNQKMTIFLIFTPVYQGGDVPSTVEGRRDKLVGFVFIPFNVEVLLNEIFASRTIPQLLNYKIYDSQDMTNQNLLHDSNTTNQHTAAFYLPRFHDTRNFVLGGNTWTIIYTNNPEFDLESEKNLSTIIVIGGLFVSIVFFALSRSQYTARTKAEIAASKLQASQKELQKAISHRDNFISIASHELKTPVTSLKVYAELLLRHYSKKGDKKTLDYLIKINRQIDKLTVLIQDLLNVSRIQKNQLTFRMELCDLNETAREAVENTQQITDHHKIVLEGKVKRKIVCDKERINQVIINLLTNAIKYSPLADKIVVKLETNKKEAVISVVDFGIGISREYQKKVFDRFYRVSDIDGETYPGLGIGLFISQAIVKRHGGEIRIISEKGKGSTFQFNLPFKKKKSTQDI